jgi:FKBP-type peptidyl-prolyl cis-trans isomerase FklB
MKNLFVFSLLLIVGAAGFAQNNNPAVPSQPAELNTAADSANYAFGVIVGFNVLRQMGDQYNHEMFMKGLSPAIKGMPAAMSPEEANRIFGEFNKGIQARAIQKYKAEGRSFAEANKKRKEVITTPSGLQYEVMKKGSGTVHPKATDKVEVHYHGTLLDGTVFDSSVDRGATTSFPLNGVIAGWTEGVQYMVVGDKFKFYIPSDLAYGDRGSNPKIKGGMTLIFEVELFKIEPTTPK